MGIFVVVIKDIVSGKLLFLLCLERGVLKVYFTVMFCKIEFGFIMLPMTNFSLNSYPTF